MHAVRWIIVGLVLTALAATGATARAEAPEACYTLDSTVLTGPAGADLTVHVATAVGCTAPSKLKKLQVKTFAGDKLDDVRNLNDIALESGSATIELGQLARGSRVESDALIHADATNRTWQARTQANALLRPDLTIIAVRAPAQTLTVRPVDVVADVAELNGDVGAMATVTLMLGPTLLAAPKRWPCRRAAASRHVQAVALATSIAVRADSAHQRRRAVRERHDEQSVAAHGRGSRDELVRSNVVRRRARRLRRAVQPARLRADHERRRSRRCPTSRQR